LGKQTVEALIEGGKATAAPPLGPALGPTGLNIGEVVAEINKKTAELKGMQVPIKVIIDTDTKEFTIEVGTPPAAALIRKEAGIDKGSSNPLTDKVADLKIEQIIKVAKIKESALLGANNKARAKEIVGTCQSMGVLVEGMPAPDALQAIDEGRFDEKITSGKTELSEEELKAQEEEKIRLQEEMEKRRTEFEAKGKDILGKFKDDAKKSRKAMEEAGIPMPIINELAPLEKEEGAAPAK
jgi:large subunit ribosomal protein L11